MKTLSAQFPCGSLTLEGVWHLSVEEGQTPVVIVCHPHPLHGGDMHNGLVVAICQEIARHPINAFRFNFRGTGESQGTFGEGIGEQEDLEAALSMVTSFKFVDTNMIGLCGYSFGAGVILPVAARNNNVQALAAISPPLFTTGWEGLEDFTKPKLFIGGSEDAIFSAQERCRFAEAMPDPLEYEIIQGADHFWLGFEEEIAKKVAAFFVKAFL